MARIRRRQGRIEYKQPDGSWSTKKPPTKPTTTAKPASNKPNPYTSGKPNPNAGGGVKGKPTPSTGYRADIKAAGQALRSGSRALGNVAKNVAPTAAKAAPGLLIGGAIAGSAGRPGTAQMSKLGLRLGKSTKTADAPVYSTPLNQNKPGPNKGPNRVRPTTPYYGPGGASSGSGEGQAQQRKPAGSTTSKPKPKPAASTSSKPKPKPQGQSKDMGENYRRWAAANPKLAAKLKKGQAGYAELKGSKTKPTASKKGSTSPSSAVKPPAKSKPKPQNFLSLSERMKKKRGY